MQQAARHRYWMKSAAIAYGAASSLLLAVLAILGATSLRGDLKIALLSGLTQWFPEAAPTMTALIDQTIAEWGAWHRWCLFLLTSGLGVGIWLKVVGTVQQMVRSDGDLASHLIPSLRQRLITVMVAIATAGLGTLALSFVLTTVPNLTDEAIAATAVVSFGQQLLIRGLRWSLALSTMALLFGLLYRASQKPTTKLLPILPGTIFATLFWWVTSALMKLHIQMLNEQHWLYSVCSTVLLSLLGLYLCAMGLLLGGQYNKLMHRYFPQPRSRRAANRPPPPSFDSFKIQKRPYR